MHDIRAIHAAFSNQLYAVKFYRVARTFKRVNTFSPRNVPRIYNKSQDTKEKRNHCVLQVQIEDLLFRSGVNGMNVCFIYH